MKPPWAQYCQSEDVKTSQSQRSNQKLKPKLNLTLFIEVFCWPFLDPFQFYIKDFLYTSTILNGPVVGSSCIVASSLPSSLPRITSSGCRRYGPFFPWAADVPALHPGLPTLPLLPGRQQGWGGSRQPLRLTNGSGGCASEGGREDGVRLYVVCCL